MEVQSRQQSQSFRFNLPADYQSPQMPAQMQVMEESTSNIIIEVNLGAKTPRRK